MELDRTVRRPTALPSAAGPGLVALALLAGAAAPGALRAQDVHRLDEPEAAFPEDFGTIQTVRELPDGRVLVADPLGGELYAVDMEAGTRTVVGRRGQGPGEYQQPDAVWPLPGDSTLLVDLGNGRLATLGPDLSFGPTRPIAQGEFRPGSPPVIALPQGVDGEGRIYFRSLGSPGQGQLPDSGNILRLARDGTVETVARFRVPDRTVSRSGGPSSQNVSVQQIPLSAEDAWGVAPDGSVAVARSGDYHVEWIMPDGSVRRGPAVPWEPIRIGTAEKEEWVAAQGRSGGGIGIGIEIENGRPSMSFSRGGQGGGRREIDQYTWPDEKPPFVGARLPVDPSGNVWVLRHVDAGEPATYDVFDRSGRRVATVLLEHGARVVGFGDGAVYVVTFDDFDLNYLERHALPAF